MIGKDHLQEHSLFGGLSDEAMKKIGSLLETRQVPAGTEIIREGETGDRLYFITEGSVEVLKAMGLHGEVGLRRIATLGAGDTFGEMELIDVQPYVATVKALEDTTVLTLSTSALHEIYEWDLRAYTMLVMNMAREISRRLRKMDAAVSMSLYGTEDEAER